MDVHDLARAIPSWLLGEVPETDDAWPWVAIATRYKAADWIESHTRAAVEAERAAIVDWLRECEAKHRAAQDDGKHRTASKHHADACRGIANAIAARKAQP